LIRLFRIQYRLYGIVHVTAFHHPEELPLGRSDRRGMCHLKSSAIGVIALYAPASVAVWRRLTTISRKTANRLAEARNVRLFVMVSAG
jgi:hypothetical protein